jgi:aspyridone synthetase trans-acting enoyl reductase
MKMCYTAIGSAGGSYIALDPIATTEKYARRDVRADWCLADTILGQGVPATGAHGRAPSPQLRHFGKQFFALAENWVQEQSITSHPINIQSGGLASIPDTINEIKLGDRNVQAQKLVIPILAY